MTTDAKTPADRVVAARLVLDTLGVSPTDLVESEPPEPKVVPTFAEFLPTVAAATHPSSRKLWINYWRVLEDEWGDRRIDEPTMSDLEKLSLKVQERAAARNGSRDGVGARSNFIDAMKRFYHLAVSDKHVTADGNPAAGMRRPTRLRSRRRALATTQLAEITEVAGTTGVDPALDTLVLRQHTETACRRSGVLHLRNMDLIVPDCTIWLREKGGVREQPVSRTLMNELLDHSQRRNPHGKPHDQVLRRLNGRPLTDNYYSWLWRRLGKRLDWVAQRGVTAHWIRYTTLQWVERNFSYALAAAYAGHAPGGSRTGNTLIYVEATLEEVATALAVLVGEPHPLALPGYRPTDDSKLILRPREPEDLPFFTPGDFGRPADAPHGPTPVAKLQEYGSPVSHEHVAAIRLVRHELEQAHQDGRQRPTLHALAYTTGLTTHAVQGAINAIELGWGEASLRQPPDDAIERLITKVSRRR